MGRAADYQIQTHCLLPAQTDNMKALNMFLKQFYDECKRLHPEVSIDFPGSIASIPTLTVIRGSGT